MSVNEHIEAFGQGNEYLERGRYQYAIELYDELIDVHQRKTDFDFNFSVDLHKIFSNKALALKRLGRYAEAIDVFTEAVQHGGKFVPAVFQMRAEANQLNGNIDAAIADLERSLQLDPQSNLSLWNLVCYAALGGDLNRVETYLHKFVEQYPDEKEDLLADSDLDGVREHPAFVRLVADLA